MSRARRRLLPTLLLLLLAGAPAAAAWAEPADGETSAAGEREERTPAAARPQKDDDGADAECGRDRRCRIERLKRRNRDRRRLDGLKRDDRIARLQELLAERVLPPRLRSPWQVDLRLARLGAVAGWTPLPHLQVEVGLSSLDGYGSIVSGPGVHGGTSLDATALEVSAVGLLSTGLVSPYASVGAAYLWGAGEAWSYAWESGSQSRTGTRITVHALRFSAGFDVLLFDHGHLRAGFVYEPPLYHQARIEPGVYDPAIRDALADWLKDDIRFHPEIRIGYAFDL